MFNWNHIFLPVEDHWNPATYVSSMLRRKLHFLLNFLMVERNQNILWDILDMAVIILNVLIAQYWSSLPQITSVVHENLINKWAIEDSHNLSKCPNSFLIHMSVKMATIINIEFLIGHKMCHAKLGSILTMTCDNKFHENGFSGC